LSSWNRNRETDNRASKIRNLDQPLGARFFIFHFSIFGDGFHDFLLIVNNPPLDHRAALRIVRGMSRVARALLFALVALWLPVTLHCRLEAAGVFTAADDCCAAEQTAEPAGDCKDDACPTVEDALFKESAHGLQIAAPAACNLPACLILIAYERDLTADPTLSPARHAPPPELRVAWQFLSRAAPPARAPSLNTVRA
jgi:hypothetical protein